MTKKIELPLKVRSTALQLNNKLFLYFLSHSYVQGLSTSKKSMLISHICIFLACKFEDIHGHLDKIMNRLGDPDLEKIIELEIEILEYLDFDFAFINAYQCGLALKYVIEKVKNIDIDWKSVTESIDRALCICNYANCSIQELSASAFDCTEDEIIMIVKSIDGLKLNYKNILKIKNEWKSIDLLKSEEIREQLKQQS